MSNPDVLACAAELSAMPDVGDLREAPAWRASLLTDARKWRCSSAQISSPPSAWSARLWRPFFSFTKPLSGDDKVSQGPFPHASFGIGL